MDTNVPESSLSSAIVLGNYALCTYFNSYISLQAERESKNERERYSPGTQSSGIGKGRWIYSSQRDELLAVPPARGTNI